MYWQLDEHASALKYALLPFLSEEERARPLVARVNVPCNYLRALVLGAFSQHPRCWDVITLKSDTRKADLHVRMT